MGKNRKGGDSYLRGEEGSGVKGWRAKRKKEEEKTQKTEAGSNRKSQKCGVVLLATLSIP